MVFKVSLMIIGGLLALLVLIQDGPLNSGIENAFGGNNLKLFEETKKRGSAKVFSQITTILMIAFMAMCIVAMCRS